MVNFLGNLALFFAGIVIDLFAISVIGPWGGIWGELRLPIIVLTLAVFYLQFESALALTLGLGLGLDLVSVYPYFSWVLIMGAALAAGRWLSQTYLTNRSLPSLMLLGAALSLISLFAEFIVTYVFSLLIGSVSYIVSWESIPASAAALGLGLLIMAVYFMINVRLRGERSRMLTHL